MPTLKRLWDLRWSAAAVIRERRLAFSTYAEDSILTALLRPGVEGTYVDVGANHPVEGSNTYRLYLRGWSGLAVDPNPRFGALYRSRRPRDIFLREGVSSTPGELTLFEFEHDTMNTLSAEHAGDLERDGFTRVGERRVVCRPLRTMVEEHLPGRQIDVLSVDCEGLDLDVLRSLDLGVHRPTTIIVEDRDRFEQFRNGAGRSPLHDHLIAERYAPIAQSGYSAIYVASDWRRLFRLSPAFSEATIVSLGYLFPPP